ncbi:unnamed protein product [Oncorhynchus mykiss]|uniref:Uncharacterized protein n=1 Tax=Oncorhynchus mykiss TaxID=8022 RepID=A0A060Y7E2_ONCMY|nr:unnamed protein product [Oncorhynchus mykiss]
MPDFNLPLEYYLIPFLITVGICLILIVVFMITKFVQDRHRARRSRLRKDQLKKLPIHKYKKEKKCQESQQMKVLISTHTHTPQGLNIGTDAKNKKVPMKLLLPGQLLKIHHTIEIDVSTLWYRIHSFGIQVSTRQSKEFLFQPIPSPISIV